MIKRVINRIKKSGNAANTQDYPDLPEVGEPASEFSLPATLIPGEGGSRNELALKDLQGHPAVLVFYPADNSSVCSSQLAIYSEALHLIEEYEAQIVAISTDNLKSHKAFADRLGINFPLLADVDPAGAVASAYGVLNPNDGLCERAIFVLDGDGCIHWRAVYPRNINPGMDGILDALESLSSIENP